MQDDEVESFHYYDKSDMPKRLHKYWHQRYELFSKYDNGIQMMDQSWWSVTPESIANEIAQHVSTGSWKQKKFIIDAFAGVGGNAIAFALSGKWERVFAIEKDAQVLQCAKDNAKVYGVEKKIWWIHGDCFEEIETRFKAIGQQAIIFASPPWGGPSYTDFEVFDLSIMEPYNLKYMYDRFSSITKEMVLYLPRNSNLEQIVKVANQEDSIPIIHYCIHGSSKALVAYYGQFSQRN